MEFEIFTQYGISAKLFLVDNLKMIYKRAFSIIELLFVLAVFGAMLLIVMPFGRALIGKNRAEARTEELRAGLRFARAAAIGLGESVKFCSSKDHEKCNGSWKDGQIVITESNKVLRILSEIPVGDELVWKGREKNTITFSPEGLPGGQRGSFCYYPKNDPENAAAVIMDITGRVRVLSEISKEERISCNL